MTNLDERVQERLAELERFASNTMPRGPVADPIGYVVWKSPTTMGPIVESWRQRVERHASFGFGGLKCSHCREASPDDEYSHVGADWPCAEYLSVCREIGVEV